MCYSRSVRMLRLPLLGAADGITRCPSGSTTSIALLSGSIAAWLERHAAARIEYLKAENRALRIRLSGRRIVFSDAERRTLGMLAKKLGRKALREIDP